MKGATKTVSVPLQSVPEDGDEQSESNDETVAQAKHEAAEIVARAHRQAEAIVAEARTAPSAVPSPLAALGDNAEEIIGQVRKLIKKQRELQADRQNLLDEIESLKSERDELVQRLTDAVERMEELAKLADMAQGAQTRSPSPAPPPPPPPVRRDPPRPMVAEEPKSEEDTSLAARLRQAERGEATATEDSSLAARLERAEREREAAPTEDADHVDEPKADYPTRVDDPPLRSADGRSFYDRHSAKLPRLEGDGGRSVLSAIGDMRPESEPKGRKGRRRSKK